MTTKSSVVLVYADEPKGACAELANAARRSRAAGYVIGVQRVRGRPR